MTLSASSDKGVVDTHCHVWNIALPTTTWPTPEWTPLYKTFGSEELAQAAASAGVTTCILIEAGDSVEADRFMQESAASAPVGAIAPFVDLASPTLASDLDSHMENPKCKAVRARFEGNPDREILTRAATIDGLRQVAERELVFEFLVSSFHLPYILTVYNRINGLRGVVEHMGKPDIRGGSEWDAWSRDMRRLAADAPVSCKLSLSPRAQDLGELLAHPGRGWPVEAIKPYVQLLLKEFGPKRLMWGSDWPIILLESDYAGALDTMRRALEPIDSKSADAIFRTSALDLYGLNA